MLQMDGQGFWRGVDVGAVERADVIGSISEAVEN
jgi:hypothetical protein